MNKSVVFLIGLSFFLGGCAAMNMTEKEQKRGELDTMAETSIVAFIEQNAEVEKELEDSVAYAVAAMKLTKIPVFGGGGGEAVLVIKSTQQHSYFNVSRFDIGGGVGARAFKVLLVFDSQEIVDKWKTGKWEFQAGAEASAGSSSAEGPAGGKGFTMHVLAEGGASATATARVIRVKVNKSLSDPL